MLARIAIFGIGFCGIALLLAAGPSQPISDWDWIRAGNEALERGDLETAEAHYTRAEERTADPGLVAFNKANVHFRRENYREAELGYLRALDDQDAPPLRRAQAWYNRGVCLILRGGVGEYRLAIESLERCLSSAGATDTLKADARHNLELAKLLWNQARAKAPQTPPPNAPPPESPPEQPKKPQSSGDPTQTQTNPGQDAGSPQAGTKLDPRTQKLEPGQTPTQTDQKTAGKGTLQVLLDEMRRMELNDEDAREWLRRTAERLEKDRRRAAAPGPEQPNVKDW